MEIENMNNMINEFYELKAKHEDKMNEVKKRIRKNKNYSKNDKMREIQNYKYKCIKCGKEGKMNFEIGPNQLKVSCPRENNPCDLSININTDKVENYYNYYDKTKKTLEVLKEEIIRKKLDLLFDLESEDVILQEFERVKEDYTEKQKKLKGIIESFEKMTKYPQKNNETNEVVMTDIGAEVDRLTKILNANISEFNEKINKEGPKGTMNYYITDILEQQNKIRQIQYYNGFKSVEGKKPNDTTSFLGEPQKDDSKKQKIDKSVYEYKIHEQKISYKNQEVIKKAGAVIEYMKTPVESDSDDEFNLMEREVFSGSNDDDISLSPTEEGNGTVGGPKTLKIKIPTEKADNINDPDSPVYIPGITNQGSTTPGYSPTSPTYGFHQPEKIDVPTSPEIQEVNLSDLKPEK